ncbi:MAG: hypothetical protein WC606_03430 [Candidatus Absconditabacterales bacterium]
MNNTPKKQPARQHLTSKFFKSVVLTGTMLLFVLKPGFGKGNEAIKSEIQKTLKQYPTKEWKIQEADQNKNNIDDKAFEQAQSNLNGNNDALSFAVNNVSKYYPDMKEHLDSLVNHFRDQEQKDTVNFLFQKHILKNITDPKKQVTSILYCIEHFVFKGDSKLKKTFSEKYDIDTSINDDEYEYLINFNKGYNKRFKGYYKKLEQILVDMNKIIDENNKIIEKQKQQIEGIVNTFTANDVKNNFTIKKLVLDTETLYIKHKYIIPTHLTELIKAAKQ